MFERKLAGARGKRGASLIGKLAGLLGNKDTWLRLAAIVAAVIVANSLLVWTANKGVEVRGDHNQTNVIIASPAVTAATICGYPETEVALVTSVAGDRHYQAKFEAAAVRYDLTWQRDGTVVAVEELRGQDFDARVEQIGPAFWQACVADQDVREVQGGH